MLALKAQIRSVLTLALPLILAEVGWMFMAVVDTIMVGHLPHPAITISAVALAQVLYNTLAFGIGGILFGLDTYLSQSHGAGKFDEANRWLLHGVILAAHSQRRPYVRSSCRFVRDLPRAYRSHHPRPGRDFSPCPQHPAHPFLMLALTLRRYLQAFNHVKAIAAAAGHGRRR